MPREESTFNGSAAMGPALSSTCAGRPPRRTAPLREPADDLMFLHVVFDERRTKSAVKLARRQWDESEKN